MTTNNVIEFPKPPELSVATDQDIKQRTEEAKLEYIDEIVDILMVKVLHSLVHYGFDLSEDEFANNYAYLVEVFRYTLWKASNIEQEHPFDDHISAIISVIDPDDDYDSPLC